MVINIKHDMNITCRVVLQEQLEKLNIRYAILSPGEVEIKSKLSQETYKKLEQSLGHYGIWILDDQKTALVQRIKYSIDDLVQNDSHGSYKISCFLSETLNYSYSYLSNLFSEMTHTSIENYVILKKVDR